ncbi:MAG: hypothetical protein MI924_11110 [Chloroflexales bacterium]|nr:hypothetical protein [Chloroflexales bacterium]
MAEIAANYAMCKHTGLFVSPELEQTLIEIGTTAVSSPKNAPHTKRRHESAQHIVHVLTRAFSIGGDSRFAWRWIQQDLKRQHSVALTRQGASPVPDMLNVAVKKTGGQIHVLNQRRGTILDWAAVLREISSSADAVILHTHPYDIIPVLAFANKMHTPPTVYVNHADHVFWVGAGVTDILANLRYSGQDLAIRRRAIPIERCAILPIILSSVQRTKDRVTAKHTLGLAPESIILLTIARPHKYLPFRGQSFPEMLLPVLEAHPQVVLVAIGPGQDQAWAKAAQRTNGRVIAFEQRSDTALFYEAADIYIDSFPLTSITSLLEAGTYATPLVSRHPHAGAISVLCADNPALDATMLATSDLTEYLAFLERLILDPDERARRGAATAAAITAMHYGSGWQESLEQLYAQTSTISCREGISGHVSRPCIEEVDVLLPLLFREEPDLWRIFQYHLRLLPLELRIKVWIHLVKDRYHPRPGLLLPEWLGASIEKWRSTWQMRSVQ